MAFWRHYYHLVWATAGRQSLITADIEQNLYEYITRKTLSQQCLLHALGGVENHIHLVVSIPPKLAVAEFMRIIKGSSSHHVEHHLPHLESKFSWQRGYGSLTFGRKQLETVVQYALNQKQHHQQGTIITGMERDDEEEDGPQILYNASGRERVNLQVQETDAGDEYLV